MFTLTNTKLEVKTSTKFKKQFKKVIKQGKKVTKFI